ncbi:arginine--tRNA ligase [Helicobacter enhydrae]|uniref:Arginine--tRNA ligase n=1 Tax=Helicobacter enhydrae TaxID=222136 RepID=A0A1B1U6L0_9HELI|nr:arginine--tRNA ligase [Helicobacter enhydrae]ANV98434.1 arginine--tRNA ligase [Helicobacter enhydrae]
MLYQKVKTELDRLLQCDVVLERPKNRGFGHFATPIAFVLAKQERKNPKILSEEIASQLRASAIFSKVETLNGYINLTLSKEALTQVLDEIVERGFRAKDLRGERILLEYVSANPTGPLHIGHARGAVYGDCLGRLGKFLGYEIVSEYYVNDAGAQISMLGNSILLAGQEEILKIPVEYPEQYYKGEYIVEVAHKAFKQFGEEVFRQGDVAKLAEFGKDLMLQEIKQNLASVDISFDSFVSEKHLYARWESVLEELIKNQGIYEDDGKLWLQSTKHDDEKDRVVVRENGEPTYLAGDIIYHQDKFLRDFAHYINIWGADHHGYIARVKSAIEFLGFDSSKLEILLSQMVKLLQNGEPYKMSKRAGNFILMQDVVDEIGSDALRFVFLCKKMDTSLEFDIDDFKKQDSSNPIFYIHYANARIYSLLEKSTQTLEEITKTEVSELDLELEELVFVASQIPSVIANAFDERSMVKICDYLKNLSSIFHAFYNAHRVIGQQNEASILKVLLCVSCAIEKGLEVLGIKAKRAM